MSLVIECTSPKRLDKIRDKLAGKKYCKAVAIQQVDPPTIFLVVHDEYIGMLARIRSEIIKWWGVKTVDYPDKAASPFPTTAERYTQDLPLRIMFLVAGLLIMGFLSFLISNEPSETPVVIYEYGELKITTYHSGGSMVASAVIIVVVWIVSQRRQKVE